MTDDQGSGPLHGVRVLDMTTDVGRLAGKVLAEFGADVLRTRSGERGPDIVGPDQPGLLGWWHDIGCGQTVLDPADPAALVPLRSLIAGCDILLEAEAPGALDRLGLSRAELSSLNPRLVHVSLSPQGADGPRAGWRTSDLVSQALGGFLSVTGDPDRPVALWGRQAATVGGLYAALSALAGVRKARISGCGSWVDLSMHEAVISCSEHVLMYWWFAEALAGLGAPIAVRQRSLHWVRAFEVVPCKRGACMVSPAAGGLLELIAWLKQRGYAETVPDIPDDDQLLALVPPLMEALRQVALETDATELFETGQALHVPFGEAYSIPQVADCVQHRHRGFFRQLEGGHSAEDGAGLEPAEAAIRIPGPLARFVETPAPPPRPPALIEPAAAIDRWSPRPDHPSGPAAGLTASDPPLSGIRILDFTHVLAGPFATRVFADLGADVIRVQTDERSGGTGANEFPYNVMWGRSKRSIQLHMKHPRSTEVLRRLVERTDVVIDNFSAGVMAGWGAGPEQLTAWNPGVVSMSMSGCGADGPWEKYVTYAPTIHALCGLTALTGPQGETDCGPGIAFNDHISGLAGAVSLLAALEHRDRTGSGQHIDLSQLEVGTYLVGPAIVDYLATGRAAKSCGNVDPFAGHLVNDVFPAADGEWVAVTVDDQADWDRARGLGLVGPDAAERVRAWMAERGADEAQRELQRVGLAAGMVQNAGHMVNDDDQLAHRDWLVNMDSSMIGTQTTERHPARWYTAGAAVPLPYRASPYLGQDNFEVFHELLGWDAEEVAVAIGEDLLF